MNQECIRISFCYANSELPEKEKVRTTYQTLQVLLTQHLENHQSNDTPSLILSTNVLLGITKAIRMQLLCSAKKPRTL